MPLADAIRLAGEQGVDLVETVPNAVPPVCKLILYPKFLYDEEKVKKPQHGKKPKEIQLSSVIAAHDYEVKLGKAVTFLCTDMKVKIALRLHRRQKAHPELGFQVVERFIKDTSAHGRPDSLPKLMGNSINLMLSPLPRDKRAPDPNADEKKPEPPATP